MVLFLVNSALGGDAAAPVNIDAGPDGVLNCISMPLPRYTTAAQEACL